VADLLVLAKVDYFQITTCRDLVTLDHARRSEVIEV